MWSQVFIERHMKCRRRRFNRIFCKWPSDSFFFVTSLVSDLHAHLTLDIPQIYIVSSTNYDETNNNSIITTNQQTSTASSCSRM